MPGDPPLVLVTGAAGFIGSHIVDALARGGVPVRGLDLLHERAHTGPPDYLDSNTEWIFGDLRDTETVERSLRGVGAVCHQAAMVGLGMDFADVTDYVSHNDTGTAVLLAALARTRFTGRLILASSMVVYGEGRYVCRRHGEVAAPARDPELLSAGRFDPSCPGCGSELEPRPVDEGTATDPRNVYAATKLHQEHLCATFARELGATLTVLRYHNVYGPRMPPDTPYAGVASLFRSALAAGNPPRVFEDGAQLRDFIHVRDVAAANLIALDPESSPGTYNVASGVPRTVLDMADALAAAVGPDAPRPMVTGQYRLGDVRHVFASTERARSVLRFEAAEEFEAGMAEFARAPLREPVQATAARRS